MRLLNLKTYCENWRSIFEMDDKDVFRKIKDDSIDILVDLSGILQETNSLFLH